VQIIKGAKIEVKRVTVIPKQELTDTIFGMAPATMGAATKFFITDPEVSSVAQIRKTLEKAPTGFVLVRGFSLATSAATIVLFETLGDEELKDLGGSFGITELAGEKKDGLLQLVFSKASVRFSEAYLSMVRQKMPDILYSMSEPFMDYYKGLGGVALALMDQIFLGFEYHFLRNKSNEKVKRRMLELLLKAIMSGTLPFFASGGSKAAAAQKTFETLIGEVMTTTMTAAAFGSPTRIKNKSGKTVRAETVAVVADDDDDDVIAPPSKAARGKDKEPKAGGRISREYQGKLLDHNPAAAWLYPNKVWKEDECWWHNAFHGRDGSTCFGKEKFKERSKRVGHAVPRAGESLVMADKRAKEKREAKRSE
jgi:hypothetical protein